MAVLILSRTSSRESENPPRPTIIPTEMRLAKQTVFDRRGAGFVGQEMSECLHVLPACWRISRG